jgi:crooked neck
VREVYLRATANKPLLNDKVHWRRYIYLWLNFAVFEETIAEDQEKTREVYMNALGMLPHDKFTFSKLWILYA